MISLCNGDGQTCKEELSRKSLTSSYAAASASALGLEMQRDTSSVDAFLGGAVTYRPPNGKMPRRLA